MHRSAVIIIITPDMLTFSGALAKMMQSELSARTLCQPENAAVPRAC